MDVDSTDVGRSPSPAGAREVTPVLTEVRDGVLIITLNRPGKRNAMNAEMAGLIGDALESAHVDPAIRVVVITAAGDTAFCAGGDLVEMSSGRALEPSDQLRRSWGFGGLCRHAIDKPVIAAVNGLAVGGGAEMVLACDLVVACEHVEFSVPEVSNGFLAAAGGLVRLPAWLPRPIAMEIVLLGRRFTAVEAQSWGLVNRVVPKGAALECALELATLLSGHAPLAVQATKRAVAGITGREFVTEEAAWSRTGAEAEVIRRTEDAGEGPLAFAEKRSPVWRGR